MRKLFILYILGANTRSFIIVTPFIFFHFLQATSKTKTITTKINSNHLSTNNPFKSSFSFKGSKELEPPELQKPLLPITVAILFLNTSTSILKCPLGCSLEATKQPGVFTVHPRTMHILRSKMGETDAFP